MKYPSLVRKSLCKTDIHVAIYGEEISEEGMPIVALEKDLKCNYQDKARKILTEKQITIQITGKAYFCGDIAPNLAVISAGQVIIFGETRQIYKGTKARNPDGTVNYTELELM